MCEYACVLFVLCACLDVLVFINVYVSVNIRVWYVLCAYLGGILFIIVYVYD